MMKTPTEEDQQEDAEETDNKDNYEDDGDNDDREDNFVQSFTTNICGRVDSQGVFIQTLKPKSN